MSKLYILFEHAAGYALFRVQEFEEVGSSLPAVEKSVQTFAKFASVVHLVSFMPFKNGANALDNMNSISEGLLHDDLLVFLQTNLPDGERGMLLGISDVKIGTVINEALQVQCQHSGVVPEIIRGIRVHFPKLVKGFTETAGNKSQLGLGHSYSRCKVKFNVHRSDNMIIQSIALLDQIDKDINTFAMRIREWYSYHFPELYRIVPDNYLYAQLAYFVKDRNQLSEESLDGLESITMDRGKAEEILQASRSSMGMDISPIDLINIECFSKRVTSLVEYRKNLIEYLKRKMHSVAPNLSVLIGEQVGARLISRAGSLTNLAKCPASTVQVLGAEKALFRAIKTRGKTPKYGVIYHSSFIAKAEGKNKGRISRFLANKCSIASRMDCFSEVPTSVFGVKMKGQVEERMKFYQTGDVPRKNIDVMKEAIEEFEQERAELAKKKKKDKKKKKQQMLEMSTDNGNETLEASMLNGDGKKEKKKKKRMREEESFLDDTVNDEVAVAEEEVSVKKKKKKKAKFE